MRWNNLITILLKLFDGNPPKPLPLFSSATQNPRQIVTGSISLICKQSVNGASGFNAHNANITLKNCSFHIVFPIFISQIVFL